MTDTNSTQPPRGTEQRLAPRPQRPYTVTTGTNETHDDLQTRLAEHPVAKHIALMLDEARAEGERAATERIDRDVRKLLDEFEDTGREVDPEFAQRLVCITWPSVSEGELRP